MLREAEDQLRQRQLVLRLRSAELRAALRRDVQALERPLQWADRGWSAWRWLRGTPWTGRVALAAGGLVLLRRPARLLRWVSAGLGWWKLAQRLSASLRSPR
ncbi:hypothetical protein G8A07_23640 [Roseateles sp. DAIF2]|uniref:YqjK family protein n=1 Tax=Roseateles sp. DAIF2 TaxID=2714952 RepID=UPI0018A308AF|nr:YqjK family protein [Roseateles sp. DAIF2]QPF75612.1 hypothetical protein G8A07_23640 [Roseateles sp. DAIF2]